jgi:hypothetical protein
MIQETVTRLGRCRPFTAFDPGVRNGLGVTFRKIIGLEDSRPGSGVAVAVGDVTLSFNISRVPQSEEPETPLYMAAAMENGLQAAVQVHFLVLGPEWVTSATSNRNFGGLPTAVKLVRHKGFARLAAGL